MRDNTVYVDLSGLTEEEIDALVEAAAPLGAELEELPVAQNAESLLPLVPVVIAVLKPFVQMAAEAAGRRAMDHGMKKIDVFVKGPGSGRETAIRSLGAIGLEVGTIQDVTPTPHNGCRPPKRRRV